MNNVLFVDDDTNILSGFRRHLKKYFNVFTAEGGEKGLEEIKKHGPFSVVVSDLRMPGMDGLEFLTKVRELTPDTILMMLTGHADLQTAIDAINKGNIYKFLIKPCKPSQLIQTVTEGVLAYGKRSQLEEKLQANEQACQRFQRLISPDLADLISSGQMEVEKGGETRVATVLFADICGFTAMSESAGANEILELLNEYFEMLVEIVFRHHGTLDKFIGDEMMVIWGAPTSHEDDPIRAVQAALDMQSAIKTFNENRAELGGRFIQIGIGINTGQLVAGYIGSSRTMSYSVIGDTVNTASRLCSVAEGGQVIVSDSTYQHIKDRFEFTTLPPIKFKGKSKSVIAYQVDGAIA